MHHRSLHPFREPYTQGFLKVDKTHSIYYEESGNPEGKTVLFLHGGPGSGTSPEHRGFFDPEKTRIILFDQRGSGKSKPHASLENNTTWDLVADMEKLRKHLHIERWGVFGGSWGSTLALAYAETHPDQVLWLIVRGIFLCRQKELDWFFKSGANRIFPDAWEEFVEKIPQKERHHLISAYYQRLTSPNQKIRLEYAKAWSRWEATTVKLIPDLDFLEERVEESRAEAIARIECHYFMNGGFFETDNYLIENVDKIRKIPGIIIHGRYDLICPFETAWELHKAWREADFHVIDDAGHASSEPGVRHALIEAAETFVP